MSTALKLPPRRVSLGRLGRRATLTLAAAATALLLAAPSASALEVVDYFGTASGSGTLGGEFESPGDIAVNQTGAGPADAGDIYALDGGNNRIQRFSHNDNGTPADRYDDTYPFVSAWGADVVQPAGAGDLGDEADAIYEVCTVALQCKAAVDVGGNGGLDSPTGIAVDQDTGNVYVVDRGHSRVNVYAGDGAFLRSFGWDVVAPGSPGNLPNDEQQTVTLGANTTGGSFGLSLRFGSGSGQRRGGSTTVTDFSVADGAVHVGDTVTGASILPGTTITGIDLSAHTLTLSQPAQSTGTAQLEAFGVATAIPHNASAATLQSKLEGMAAFAAGDVAVSGAAGGPWTVTFQGAFADRDIAQMSADASGLTVSSGSKSAIVATTDPGGSYEVCVEADGDVCQAGVPGASAGQLEGGISDVGIAVSQPEGSPATGTVFLADPGNRRVNTYTLDGSVPGSVGSAAQFGSGMPQVLAVDSRGILYASDDPSRRVVERYDTEDANGSGVGFLAPIVADVDEQQQLTVSATAGTFKLTLNGETTADLPFDVKSEDGVGSATPGVLDSLDEALEALPSIGPHNVRVSGGPGDAAGSKPYTVTFTGALSGVDLLQMSATNGATPLSGGTGPSLATTRPAEDHAILAGGANGIRGLEVDPDSDGAGPDADVLYVLTERGQQPNTVVQQIGPAHPPGLAAPPPADDARHGTVVGFNFLGSGSLGFDEASRRLFVANRFNVGGVFDGIDGNHGVYVLDEAGPPPTATLDSCDNATATTVDCQATINPNGTPPLSYRFQYSRDGGANWATDPSTETLLGAQTTDQAVDVTIDPPATGLDPNTAYQFRLIATRPFFPEVVTAPRALSTLAAPPLAETTGAPLRSPTTAILGGRVAPLGSAATFHFEWGLTDSYGTTTTTPAVAAGSGQPYRLAATPLTGLTPETTYHYRLVADNGVGAPVAGEDRTFTTSPPHGALSHGDFPGAPGSDRAYEMVSLAESGGNPIDPTAALASTDGNRAVYVVQGGTPISDTGSYANANLAERSESAPHQGGWETKNITPRREQLVGQDATLRGFSSDLSQLAFINLFSANSTTVPAQLWRLEASGAAPVKLVETSGPPQEFDPSGVTVAIAEDSPRAVVGLSGDAFDPAHPEAASETNIYDVTAGAGQAPKLVTLLPGAASAPACGAFAQATSGKALSADGQRLFFTSRGDNCATPNLLYMRDLDADATVALSPAGALSGARCDEEMVRIHPQAAFFWTQSRLVGADSAPSACGGNFDGDLYRFDLGDQSLRCLTCGLASIDADVAAANLVVSDDASRAYFTSVSSRPLALGAAAGAGTYRLDLGSGGLRWLGPQSIGFNSGKGLDKQTTPAGSAFVFASASAELNPAGGATDNGGGSQLYRYDDSDGSLACVSCPADGSAALGSVDGQGAAISDDGQTIAFGSQSPLVSADQNTVEAAPSRGTDVYEWRGGRHLLVTDGISDWVAEEGTVPAFQWLSASGRDIFFTAYQRLTPDAPDAYGRLYDARIGGGFEFPPPGLPPCDLNTGACEGAASKAHDFSGAGTAAFEGQGDPRDPFPRDCSAAARAAKRLATRAKPLRRAAKRSSNPRRAKALRRKAKRLAKTAKKRRASAKRCRRANRRASR